MRENNFYKDNKEVNELSGETNLLRWCPVSGNDWTTNIREECFTAPNRLVKEQKSYSKSNLLLFSTLTSLALLVAAHFISALKTFPTTQENPVILSNEQLIED